MTTTQVHPTPWQRYSRPGLSLRPAVPTDVVALAGLKRRVESRCYAHLGTPAAMAVRLHRRCTAWYLLSRIGEGDLLLVAEAGGSLVGLGAASLLEGPTLRLHSAYVEHGGLGAGRALTAARLEAAERLGVEDVVADCFIGADAAADRLRRLGLVETGRGVSPTFPGVGVSHWAGLVHTALERATS